MVREKCEREWAETGRSDPRIGIPDHYTVIESQIGRIEKDVSEVKSVLDELKSLMKDRDMI